MVYVLLILKIEFAQKMWVFWLGKYMGCQAKSQVVNVIHCDSHLGTTVRTLEWKGLGSQLASLTYEAHSLEKSPGYSLCKALLLNTECSCRIIWQCTRHLRWFSSSLWESGTTARNTTVPSIKGLTRRCYSKLLVQVRASCPRQPISRTNGI